MKRKLCVLICLSLWGVSGEARPQNPSQADLSLPGSQVTQVEQVPLRPPSSLGYLNLTVKDAVRLALENNPALKVEKIRLEQARSRIETQKGEFDFLLNSTSRFSHQDNIVASRFYPTGLYTEIQKSQNLGVEARSRYGTRVIFGINYADLRSTSNTQTLSPQYSANLSLSFTQPLLRDFGRSATETRLHIAEKGAEIAEGNLFVRVSQLIQRVEEAYWNYVFLLRDLDGKQRSLNNSREFLSQQENLLLAGRIAPVSVLQARAAVAEREGEVITAQARADQYEDQLKNLLWLNLGSTDLSPADSGDPAPPVLDAQASLAIAVQRRPELQALQRESEQRDIEIKYAGNQLRPRLDLTAQYTAAGLSGKPNPTCLDPTTSFCIPVGTNVAGSILASRTGVRDAFTPLLSANPFEGWSVELKFQMPIGNRAAEGQYSEASLRRLETETNITAIRDQIEVEIREAVREAQAAQKRIESARQAIAYVEDQLDGMRLQLDAGLVSSYDVLRAFDEVDKARTTELQATMDFNVALSKVRLAEASSFQTYNIEVAGVPQYLFEQTGTTR